MYKKLWALSFLIWILSLLILIIALTDIWPNNLFSEYRLVIGIFFFNITALLKLTYEKFHKSEKPIS